MPLSFDSQTRALLDGKNFATVATLGPGGAPQLSVIWVKREGDTVVFTTHTGRQKARNLARDPRVSLSVYAADNPYATVEIRGTAVLEPDETRALSMELSHKYLDEDPPADPEGVGRLIVRIVPSKVISLSV
jgi:PPOX class probable F420-dependent enzyme